LFVCFSVCGSDISIKQTHTQTGVSLAKRQHKNAAHVRVTAPVHFETSVNLHKFIGWIRHQSTSRRQSKDQTVTVRSSIGEEDFLKLLILS